MESRNIHKIPIEGHRADKLIQIQNNGRRHEQLVNSLSVPFKCSKAMRMMSLMGWEGGALGAKGEGITDPIMPHLENTKQNRKRKRKSKKPKEMSSYVITTSMLKNGNTNKNVTMNKNETITNCNIKRFKNYNDVFENVKGINQENITENEHYIQENILNNNLTPIKMELGEVVEFGEDNNNKITKNTIQVNSKQVINNNPLKNNTFDQIYHDFDVDIDNDIAINTAEEETETNDNIAENLVEFMDSTSNKNEEVNHTTLTNTNYDFKCVFLSTTEDLLNIMPVYIQGLISISIEETKQLPLLKCHGVQNGALVYSCHTKKSYDWLQSLCVANEINIVTKEVDKMSLKINSFLDFDFNYFLSLIQLYNKDLITKKWCFLNKKVLDDSAIYYVKMDQESFKYILNSNMALYAGLDKIIFDIIWE